MQPHEVPQAIEAAKAVAISLGLDARDAVILQEANRITARLLPADVVVRVAPSGWRDHAEFELALTKGLIEAGGAVAGPDTRVEPRAHVAGQFAITFWTHHAPIEPAEMAPAEYADALARLHAAMRKVEAPAPHFSSRVDEAQGIVENPELSPALPGADRDLLSRTIRTLRASIERRGAPEQLLHGEPHPGNLLRSARGPVFIDFETCCRGPVEFDIAHAPEDVSPHYPGVDMDLLAECRTLSLALVAAWRWDRDDQFPDGRQMGIDLVDQIRASAG